jgi:UPF0176 protein
MAHQVLLYYWYGVVRDPEKLMHDQRQLCERLNLKGRIIVAAEGINATVEGLVKDTAAYVVAMQKDKRFKKKAIDFKYSTGTGEAFPKLSVKLRTEIVSSHFGDEDFNPAEFTAPYFTAEELHTWIEEKKEFYIIDMRNSYEHAVGHFAGSILPTLRNFRDLKDYLPKLGHLKDKTVVTVCTGGVRCEKASGFLLKHGFTDVYQLYGGIVTYMEKYPNQNFLGKLYVFDNRVVMGFNTESPEHVVVGTCEKCGQPSENYVNDDGGTYRHHFICCSDCVTKYSMLTPVRA